MLLLHHYYASTWRRGTESVALNVVSGLKCPIFLGDNIGWPKKTTILICFIHCLLDVDHAFNFFARPTHVRGQMGSTSPFYSVRFHSVPLMLSQSGFRLGSSMASPLTLCSSMAMALLNHC